MKVIKISDIQVDERQRKLYAEEPIAKLEKSISELGLLHAIVLHRGKLIAGGRRLKAISLMSTFGHTLRYQGEEIEAGHVPYTEFDGQDILLHMRAELEENLQRESLTMAEEMAAKADIHRLRVMENPEHTKQDTARELSKPGDVLTTTDIRDALIIDEHLDDPEVAKAKTQKEAMKIIQKKKQAEKNVMLAEEFQSLKIADAKSTKHDLQCIDMVEGMQAFTSEVFDVILTDPPYGIEAQTFNGQKGVAHTYDDTRENFERIIESIAVQGYRVCKREAHAYIFLDFENWEFIAGRMERAGWSVWPRPIIWSKGNGLLARPDFGPRYTHEYILYAIKGNRKVTRVATDVIAIRTLSRQRRGAEKPSDLYLDLLRRSVQPGNKVLDPCCGLGAIFPAANTLNCVAFGMDADSEAVGYATTRMELTVEQDNQRRATEFGEEAGESGEEQLDLNSMFGGA